MDQVSILEALAIQLAEKLADPAVKDAAKRESVRKDTLACLIKVIGSLSLVAESQTSVAESMAGCAALAQPSADSWIGNTVATQDKPNS
jgi:hypothetical protein